MNPQNQVNARHRHQPWYFEALEEFPRPGSKLRFRSARATWFKNLRENAERELRCGEIYTLRTIELFSSWACVTLVETGETEYALGFFERVLMRHEPVWCLAPADLWHSINQSPQHGR